MWKDILKNIQISGQKTSSKDYVLPDEEEDDCKKRFVEMMEFVEDNWKSSVTIDEDIDYWPDNVFCQALNFINDNTFLFHNPTNTEGEIRRLYKYKDAWDFYKNDNFKSDITADLGNDGFVIKVTYRMVAVRPNLINIFCSLLFGNINLMSHCSFQISETFNISGDEFTALIQEKPDEGGNTVGIPKNIEPSYIKNKDWRKF